jgi:hypothetical protein
MPCSVLLAEHAEDSEGAGQDAQRDAPSPVAVQRSNADMLLTLRYAATNPMTATK